MAVEQLGGGGDGGGSRSHAFTENLITNWFIEIDHRIGASFIHLEPAPKDEN